MTATPRTPWWARNTTQPVRTPDQVTPTGWRTRLTLAASATVVLAALGATLHGIDQPLTTPGPNGTTVTRASVEALLAGCGPTYTASTTDQATGEAIPAHRADGTPNQPSYSTTVPITGPFWPTPAPTTPGATRYWTTGDPAAPTPETLLHNQWQGDLVIYYTPTTAPQDQITLRTLATQADLDLLVAPWPSERGPLPEHRKIAIAAWGATQTCQRLNAAALAEFRTAHPAADAPGAAPRATVNP